MGHAQAIARMTTGESIAWEDTQADKHELLAWQVHTRVDARRVYVAGNCFAPLEAHLRAETVMHHPKVIVEWLSETTAATDRGAKFAAHRQLESLREYALIDPDRRAIEVYRRMPGGDWWLAVSVAGQGLIPKRLDFAASPEAVFEDVDTAADDA